MSAGAPSPAARMGFPLERREFFALRDLIHRHSGIALRESKKALVESRLVPRLRALGLESFEQYVRLVEHAGSDGEELRQMLNCITTNKTSFFREPHHFEYLSRTIIPEIVKRARHGGERKIRIWSAGCSRGQEPYTIAMSVRDALGPFGGWDVRILASDIDTKVLEFAEAATYENEELDDVPARFRKHAFMAVDGRHSAVSLDLRRLITFRRINLIDREWPIRTQFDVIFFRNVAIYFDRETQRMLYDHMVRLLRADGYLIAGHSENLHWLAHLLRPVGGTVYRPVGAPPERKHSRAPAARATRSMAPPRQSRRPRSLRPAPSRPPPPAVSIHAGGLHASNKGNWVRTILGSCVAACLFDPVTRVGGMNHFMLPDARVDAWMPTRFGVHAMEVLINSLLRLGAERERIVAKAFGGANVIASLSGDTSVAQRNQDFIHTFLAEENIPLVAKKLGGRDALEVRFDTATGRALVRKVARSEAPQVIEEVVAEERNYLDHMSHIETNPSADVTLF